MKYKLIEEDYSQCPYYKGTGICDSGCYSEPICKTNEPDGGWPVVYEFDTEEEIIHYLGEEELFHRLNAGQVEIETN